MNTESALSDAIAAFQQGDLTRARALIERAVSSAAPNSYSFYLMGLIECRSGRLDAGVEWLSRACKTDGGNLNYRINLAKALIDSHRYHEALEVAERPPGTSPHELALWQMRAQAADGAEAWDASQEAWRKLCTARPDDWQAWFNAGSALGKLGRWQLAVEALQCAVNANPGELVLRRGLAAALARAARYEDSADELNRCVQAAPDDIPTRITFARLLADLGREQECRAQLDEIAMLSLGVRFDEAADRIISIAALPDGELDVPLLQELAQLLERTNRPEALETLIAAARQRGLRSEQLGYGAAAAALRQARPEQARDLLLAQSPDRDPVGWHWLMARIADALGDTGSAFAEAQAMNMSVEDYEGWRRRGERHLQFIRGLADNVTPEWCAGIQTLPADERPTPAFLVGFPRSGTTLLDTFLMGHPATAVLEEIPLIDRAQQFLGASIELPKRSRAQLEIARDSYFDEMSRHVEPGFSGLIVDKMPLNMLGAPLLHSLFSEAHFIFVQRHPCDVVLSCFMQGFGLNESMSCFLDLQTAAAYYDAAMSLWSRSKEYLPLKVHTLVYEELITDPGGALHPLVEFLGLDWQPRLLDHRSTAKGRSAITTPSYNQVTQALTAAPCGRWKRYEKDLEPVLPILLPWAHRLGYVQAPSAAH